MRTGEKWLGLAFVALRVPRLRELGHGQLRWGEESDRKHRELFE